MQKNDTWKVIVCFFYVLIIAMVAVFCVLNYNKKPTDEEISEYIASGGKTAVTTGVDNNKTEAQKPTTEEAGNPLLPGGATAMPDATVADIVGYYEGKAQYNTLSGYENMDGVPDNINEMVAAELASPKDAILVIEEDGRWELKIKSDMGMTLSDDLFTDKDFDGKLKSLNDGYFKINREVEEGSDLGKILFEGKVYEASGSKTIAGHAHIEMEHGGTKIVIDYEFSVDYVREKEDEGES